jgi:NAD(P)-dependent dehydrogenase (short-subunit alcohol dehydrogenase family)
MTRAWDAHGDGSLARKAPRFQGKVCVITGGGGNLGIAMARRFAEEAATVVLVDSDEARLELAVNLLGTPRVSGAVHGFWGDVSAEEDVRGVCAFAKARFHQVDILVNNAGFGEEQPSLETTPIHTQRLHEVIVGGTFLCSQKFGTSMCEQGGGAIVNISSITTRVTQPRALAYSCSKAAVNKLTEVLAVEWARYGVRVNAVAPGPFEKEDGGRTGPDQWKSRIPLRRFGLPSEIAAAVSFLASDDASYITGQCLYVDGGWTAFGWANDD